jgi:hypothetical protein
MSSTSRRLQSVPVHQDLMHAAGKTCDSLMEIAHCTRGLALACRGAAAMDGSSECEAMFELADMIEHKIADVRSELVTALEDAGGRAS